MKWLGAVGVAIIGGVAGYASGGVGATRQARCDEVRALFAASLTLPLDVADGGAPNALRAAATHLEDVATGLTGIIERWYRLAERDPARQERGSLAFHVLSMQERLGAAQNALRSAALGLEVDDDQRRERNLATAQQAIGDATSALIEHVRGIAAGRGP